MKSANLRHGAGASRVRLPAVVFDLDDTLYPERQYAISGFSHVAERFAKELGDPARSKTVMLQLFESRHRRSVFDVLPERLGLPRCAALIERMIDAYRRHTPRIALHDDADRVLSRLRPDAVLAIITDGRCESQQAKIDALGLADRVDEIILTAALGFGFEKPHPKAFEEMAARLDRPPEQCAYVADNPRKDFLAPLRLGWRTVQILRWDGIYRDEPYSENRHPHAVITCLDELDEILFSTTR